ncbi:MAG: GNAT family N-acetyltransferase [Rhodobacteraceae bacterium]|nr:GNAT family N-acetyltransferase [Paracoccaceae bacterium]
MSDIYLETDRLILRPWRDEDLAPFAEMNADPMVMEYFPSTLTRTQSDDLVSRAQTKFLNDGFCFQPAEEKDTGSFIGFVGLSVPSFPSPVPFQPCVEIGWRLDKKFWGRGYASEAALCWLGFGFETLGLSEIVSFTAEQNRRSQRVMERIGMRRTVDDDFLHPALPDQHPLQRHVLYRLSRP